MLSSQVEDLERYVDFLKGKKRNMSATWIFVKLTIVTVFEGVFWPFL